MYHERERCGMHRRTYLQSVGVAAGAGLAGCSTGGASRDDNDTDESVPGVVDVRAVPPATDDGEFVTKLRVEWASRAAEYIDPDEAKGQFSRGDTQHVVCQFRVSNVGDRAVSVSPETFQLAARSVDQVFASKPIDDPDQFPERRLDPEDVANGWVVFTVTRMRTVFLLALDQSFFPVPVDAAFEWTDLPFTIDDGDTGTTAPDETGRAAGAT
jgi:hypothetical protein